MARMRSIKPEFWDDQELAEQTSRDARLFYIGLWNFADEHSRVRGDARYLKGKIFAYDDDVTISTIAGYLAELEKAGKLVIYAAGQATYLYLRNLRKHQRLEPGVPSRLPSPPLDADESASDANKSPPRADKSAPRAKRSSLKHVAGSMLQAAAARGADKPAPEPGAKPPGGPPAGAAAAAKIIQEATGCTAAEAALVAAAILADRKPRNLAGLAKTMAAAGELPDWLAKTRATAASSVTADAIAAARRGPECPHGEPGGAAPHPVSGQPLCPMCRALARRRGAA